MNHSLLSWVKVLAFLCLPILAKAQLYYAVSSDGQLYVYNQTTCTSCAVGTLPLAETYTSNTGILPYCVPAGSSTGTQTVSATTVTDQYCTCN